MRLVRVAINNYKSIPPQGVTVDFRERLAVLVGKNNSGKSNIVDAIGCLFGYKNPRYIPFPAELHNDPSQPIIIEAELSEVTYGDGKALGLSDPQCHALTPKDRDGNPKPGHGRIALKLVVPPNEGNPSSDASEDDDDEENAKQTFVVILGEKTEVKRNEDLRKALVKHILVPPLRAQSDILSPSTWTAYGRLLRDILADSSKADELSRMIEKATASLREILQEEAKTLSRAAKSTAYVDDVSFRLTREGNPIELLRNLSLSVTFAGRTEDISAVGTGTQSAVIIGVLELCLRHRARRGVRFFVVEEPELFLHPHASRYIARLLREIAAEERSNVLLTTHSPSILTDTDILDVILVDRDPSGGTRCLRVPHTFTGLEKAERILTPETCEMLFADRIILVEGPSESEILPRISTILGDHATQESFDFDRLNVSVVGVDGKEQFKPYTDLLDHFELDWRIVTDSDAVTGSALAIYRDRAGVTSEMPREEQIRRLRDVGVAVLAKGEIEDYYPDVALAAIAGCQAEDVPRKVAECRVSYDEPSSAQIVEAVIEDHLEDIGGVTIDRIPKLVQGWYSQTLQRLRKDGVLARSDRKTGEALCRWLKAGKPVIATRITDWLLKHPSELPIELRELANWLVGDMVKDRSSKSSGDA